MWYLYIYGIYVHDIYIYVYDIYIYIDRYMGRLWYFTNLNRSAIWGSFPILTMISRVRENRVRSWWNLPKHPWIFQHEVHDAWTWRQQKHPNVWSWLVTHPSLRQTSNIIKHHESIIKHHWLVVSTILKNEWVRQWEGWQPIYELDKWQSCSKPPTRSSNMARESPKKERLCMISAQAIAADARYRMIHQCRDFSGKCSIINKTMDLSFINFIYLQAMDCTPKKHES